MDHNGLHEQVADLAKSDRPVSMQALRKLSNLTREQATAFSRAWPALPVERRQAIVQGMTTLAEDNVELNFDAVYRVALKDEDGVVRSSAIEGLWENSDASTAEHLLDLLVNDPDSHVRATAATSLARFNLEAELGKLRGDLPGMIEAALLRTTANPSEPAEVRRRAVEAIGYLSHPQVPGIIEAAYREGSQPMRAGAIRAMGHHGDPCWLDLLLDELVSPDPALRYEAARSAGHLEDRRAVPLLKALLDDRDREVRLAAVGALGEIGGREAREAINRFLGSEDEAMAEAADEALQTLEFGEDSMRL